MNQFLDAQKKINEFGLTDNGALTNIDAGDELVEQFAKAGGYRDRPLNEVFQDQEYLHDYDNEMALKFVFYLRMITRKIKNNIEDTTTKKVQRGQGNRDEAFKRLLWYLAYEPEVFYNNLYILPLVGSWKDIIQLAFMAQKEGIPFDYNKFYNTLHTGLIFDENLVKKFLPRIRSQMKCTTDWSYFSNNFAKGFATYLGIDFSEYRKFKNSGNAHDFQKRICNKEFDKLNFEMIPGKALMLLTNGKFFQNHKLTERLTDWVKSIDTINFNGYVYELGQNVNRNSILPLYQRLTIDKQFENLIKTAKMDNKQGVLSNRKVICAIDRSGSMEAKVMGKIKAMTIAESLGIFFSSLMEGEFKDWVIRFSQRSEWVKLPNTGFCDKKLSMRWGDCPSNTDAISVIKSIADIRLQIPNIPLEDFPNTLVIVSDMEFDNCGTETVRQKYEEILLKSFPEEWVKDFVFIWWDVTGRKNNYPATIEDGGNYMFSGFDGSIITTLLGGVQNNSEKPSMLDIIKKTLDQEILQKVNFVKDIPF
jgi:hypothetical protein